AWRALGGGRWFGWNRAAVAILVSIGYATFDECHQWFVPGRECAFSDWSCDAAGAAIAGLAAARMCGQKSCRRVSGSTQRRPEQPPRR
ncbi:MAG: VanZ family protein, partial [Armatimonadota bacterium]